MKTDVLQFLILLVSGLFSVVTGFILDLAITNQSFKSIEGLVALIPALMGLKGNLEITMASRMSTLFNIRYDSVSWKEVTIEIVNDMVLVQSQATVVSIIAAIYIIVTKGLWHTNKIITICTLSILTSNSTCLGLGLLISLIIIATKNFGHDPDDFSGPVASSMGDLVTVLVIICFAFLLKITHKVDELPIEAITAVFFFLILEPILLYLSFKNSTTRHILLYGWTPIIVSMIISETSGLLLEKASHKYKSFILFQPLFNGFIGNCVAIQASRIATSLHRMGDIGTVSHDFDVCVSPYYVFCSKKNVNSRTTCVLIVSAIPCKILFILLITITDFMGTSLLILLYYLLGILGDINAVPIVL
ncbi:solute carrier family 41 member 3-like [Oppia nitens]|uniref:solute carrier family 41 member 3-like n=1 Tax=Oppia nitens TaxID=1686743 RepID=UPI0023DC54C3|nr:solute carrier family 41 member 3-like [Oppia nitens]